MYLNRVQVSSYSFDEQQILKGVDISLEKFFNPRIFPLSGVQGCGKSTLLKMIFAKVFYGDSANSRISKAIKLDISDRILKTSDRIKNLKHRQ